ncbi:MAG: TonB family protein, partial [Candidatus Cryptobacteroides sp.]
YNGANGNASGMALMIELARMLSTNAISLGRSVLFVGFGASAQSYAGAWYFLNRQFSDADAIDAMVNLDCVGTTYNGFYAYTASNNDLNTVLRSLEGELLPIRPEVLAYETYPSDHRAFYAKEIPAICFSTGKYAEYNTERDTESILDYSGMEKELEYVYACVLRLSRLGSAPLFHNAVLNGQRNDSEVIPYYECDVKPSFLNSTDPRQFLTKWVYAYLKYPREAVENGIQGTVMVEFVIGADGKVRDARVVRSVSEVLDAEAIKVVSASPKWKPGKVKGIKVACSMTLPIEFRLEKSRRGSFGINDIIVTK